MNLLSKRLKNEYLAKFIFLIIPTWIVCFFIFYLSSHYNAILMQSQYKIQSIYLGLGILCASIFYYFKFRFLPTFVILILIFYTLYYCIDKIAYGEFDAFFFSIQFLIFAILFCLGWFLAWGFVRNTKFPIVATFVFFVIAVLLISKQNKITFNSLLGAFVPLISYSIYIFYAVQVIEKNKDLSQPFWWQLNKKLGLFILFLSAIVFSVIALMQKEIQKTIDEYGGGGKKGDGFVTKEADGTYKLNNLMKLKSKQRKEEVLLFVAKINIFFEDEMPNPLYLTSFYYSKYDANSETFEPDSLIPESDLFQPDPSKIALYFTQTDSSVIKTALKQDLMTTVDIEVYKTLLSPTTFVAPTTSFFVQPIAIDKNDKEQYRSAYRAKSYVSKLNSAYFVYNPNGNPFLETFQNSRFEILRKATDYSNVSKSFLDYYTAFPKEERFIEISKLAHEITINKQSNVDKVIAIRDYFLSKDGNGKPLFKYSDNPGIPDIPSMSKLNNFLFENRKGYCAYYAGATLFMLRSLGIPSRIVAGFLTQDRNSGNNKGWYWFYSDQAHAWVQVYFPGYGWIDFDTTVGNEDAQDAPQADGTPPNTQGNPLLAIDGLITKVDTLNKQATIKSLNIIFKDRAYKPINSQTITLDLKVAAIQKDSLSIKIAQMKVGDSATAISFADTFKSIPFKLENESEQLIASFPKPAPIDEVHIKIPKLAEENATNIKHQMNTMPKWKFWLYFGAISIIILLGLFSITAFLYANYLKLRSKMSQSHSAQMYWDFKYAQFYLHQLGFEKDNLSAMQYALNMDQKMPLKYTQFVQLYLKLKYAQVPLTQSEQAFSEKYINNFKNIINQNIQTKTRIQKFWNPIRTINFIKTFN